VEGEAPESRLLAPKFFFCNSSSERGHGKSFEQGVSNLRKPVDSVRSEVSNLRKILSKFGKKQQIQTPPNF
jgi:hypothetical protein